MKKTILLALSTFLVTATSVASPIIFCSKSHPQWTQGFGNALVSTGRGPGVIINTAAKRVTWIGTGSSIYLDGEQTQRGVKITRARGNNSAVESITKVERVGQVLDLRLQDSLGGVGLLRVSLDRDGLSGRATWQHATDSSREQFDFCTTNLKN